MSDAPSLSRPFWMLWGASTATNLGDGIRLVALPLLATQLTRDPSLIALVTVFTYLPALLVGPIAGVLVDRLRKRNVIAFSHSTRAGVLVTVAVALGTGTLSLILLCAAAFLYGLGEALADPASHAILPQLVPDHLLGRANANLQTGQIVGEMFVGRALGGVLFAVAQPLPILANVLLLATAGAIILGIGQVEPRSPQSASSRGRLKRFVDELSEGIVAITHSRLLGRMAVLLAVWAGVSGAFWGVAAVYALRDLHSGAMGFGLMLAVAALGSILGARLAVPIVRRLGAATTAVCAVIASAVSIIGLTWAGRVSSTYRVLATLALPVGAALAGLLAAHTGASPVFLVSGLVLLATGTVLLPMLWTPFSAAWPRGQAQQGRLPPQPHRAHSFCLLSPPRSRPTCGGLKPRGATRWQRTEPRAFTGGVPGVVCSRLTRRGAPARIDPVPILLGLQRREV